MIKKKKRNLDLYTAIITISVVETFSYLLILIMKLYQKFYKLYDIVFFKN